MFVYSGRGRPRRLLARAVLIGCLEMKFKTEREGARQKILTPLGDRRGGSAQHQREGGLSCSP